MRRGEIWTISGGGYAGKPQPAVVIQDDRFNETKSLTVCIFTTTETDAALARISVVPSDQNGLREPSHIMVDKITTIPRTRVGRQIGRLEAEALTRLDRALLVFLGLAARTISV